MTDPAHTDRWENLQDLGYTGTDKVSQSDKDVSSSGSGTSSDVRIKPEEQIWAEDDIYPGISHRYPEDTSRVHKRLTYLENEAVQWQKLHWEVRKAQEMMEVESVSGLFMGVKNLNNEINEMQSEIDKIRSMIPEDLSGEVTKDHSPNTEDLEKARISGMREKYIVVSQIAFALIALAAIGVGAIVQNQDIGLIATLLAPLFIALSFGGVIAERFQMEKG